MTRNVVVLAGVGTDPAGLLRQLAVHPHLVVSSCPGLAGLLHGTSRGLLQAERARRYPPSVDVRRFGDSSPGCVPAPDPVELARAASGAVLEQVFARLRLRWNRDTVVVWDSDGLAFPFADPPDIHAVLLYRDPETVARQITSGARLADASSCVEAVTAAHAQRVRVWGLAESRILKLEEGELGHVAGIRRLLAFLDVARDPDTIGRILGHGHAAARTSAESTA